MGTSKVFQRECNESREFEFPIVAKSRQNSMIILFSSEKKGTVLVGDNKNKVGWYSESWTNCFDPVWEILFEVTITFKS